MNQVLRCFIWQHLNKCGFISLCRFEFFLWKRATQQRKNDIVSETFTLKCVADLRVPYENMCYTLPVYRPKKHSPSSQAPSSGSGTLRFQTCERKIKWNKKHHCVQTHNPCRGSRPEKGERCFAPSGHEGVERFEARSLTLERARGKATLDIMKHSVRLAASRTFWLKPFCELL